MKNLWVLTEERPKIDALKTIFETFCKDNNYAAFVDNVRILPIIDNDIFTSTYEVTGFRCSKIDNIYIKIVSGYSSFVDFLLFYQKEEPVQTDKPLYLIEETKTDDKESRNTGVYQRCSKFVFADYFYPEAQKIMLYNIKVGQKKEPTETYIFGTRLLLTIGVRILGKSLDSKIFIPFQTIEELISFKSNMRKPPLGNVPIDIKEFEDKIQISGRLIKSGSLSHDPNIGALSIIAKTLRVLNYNKIIEITMHGLNQNQLGKTNKFIKIANKLSLLLEELVIPSCDIGDKYWKYDKTGEKLATIFMHIAVDSFTSGYSIFENHAGCEKGYFITRDGEHLSLEKYKDRAKYKSGDKTQNLEIPDLVLVDDDRSLIVNIEGKKFVNLKVGLEQLETYDYFEKEYVNKYYKGFEILRTLILYGGKKEEIGENKVGFLLNDKGKLILGIKAPELFKEAIKNLLNFWRV